MADLDGKDVQIDDWTAGPTGNTGPRMRAVLKKLRMSQQALAVFLGVSITSVSRWCNGKHQPDFRTRRTIQFTLERKDK